MKRVQNKKSYEKQFKLKTKRKGLKPRFAKLVENYQKSNTKQGQPSVLRGLKQKIYEGLFKIILFNKILLKNIKNK